ncbi:MAG: NAD-dependent epimerase/dehydratase family protein [Deltaproteobacteria bacterium]|nr:NAD-dependent epimerase/dehydratase family protein [Deltaproteobacteria bacterium]
MKWLITGGCGFIGSSFIKRLLTESRNKIRVVDNLSVGTREDLAAVCDFEEISVQRSDFRNHRSEVKTGLQVELVVGDITDQELMEQSAMGVDCIVHLAANSGVGPSVENPREDMQANVIGTLNMLEAARKNSVERFIFASSSAPVGETEPPVHENIAPRPVSPYGASKLAGEGYCSAYYRTFGLNTVALRFGNVYGPGSTHKSSVVAKFIKQALQGETCEIYGDGKQTRDFIYIDDLVLAILKAAFFDSRTISGYNVSSSNAGHSQAQPRPWGEIFQIATNKEHTVNELAEILALELKNHGVTMQIKHGKPMRGDIRRNYSDTSKAKEMLGWECQTGLHEGLAKTVEWFVYGKRGACN